MLTMLISLAIVAAVLFYFYQKNSPKRQPNRAHSSSTALNQNEKLQSIIASGKYWGLSITPTQNTTSCSAALQLKNKQFPINSVPTLPLQNCSQNHCYCKHTGLLEKRSSNSSRRLRHDRREAIRFEEISDRRSHTDRRSNIWFHHE